MQEAGRLPKRYDSQNDHMTQPSHTAIPSLRSEMLRLSLFGGRLAVSELILFSLFLTDILMLGMIGELSLTAALLVNSCFVLCYVTALGLLQGGLPIASRYFEEDDLSAFHGVTGATLVLALICAAVVLITFLAFPPVLHALSYPHDLITECWRYIAFILPALVLAMIYIAVRNAIIATGNSRGFIELSVAGLALNALFNYVLGFGVNFGSLSVPAMGIAGIGLASSIVETLIFLGFCVLLWKRGFRLYYFAAGAVVGRLQAMSKMWAAIRPYMRQTTRIGLAVALIFFVDSTLFSGVLIMVGRHDVQGMAALALIFEWVALAVMIPVGLSEAIVQRVAQVQSQFELGDDAADLPAALRVILRASYLVTSLYLLIVSIVFIGFDINIPTLFIVDNEAHPALIERLDRYALLGLLVAVFMSFIIVFAAILRGMLDVRTSMIAVVVCYWGIGLGATFVLVELLGGGADAALNTVTIALGVGTATLVARLWVLIGRSQQAPVSG